MSRKILSTLKFLIGWPLSLISLIFVGKLIYSNSAPLAFLKHINLILLTLSIITFLAYFILRSILWQEITKKKGNKLSYKKTAYLWEISEIKRYTPGNIWSFLSRTNLFVNEKIATKDVIYSLVSETILILLSSLLLSFFYISYFLKNHYINYALVFISVLLAFLFVFSNKLIANLSLGNKLNLIKNALALDKDYYGNFKILLICVAAFFCFGLATYFSAVSIFYLNLQHITTFISLFVFALLVGYLSIITPMGLGVREGVTTLGLSSFIGLPQAGLISIFSRIIFIISEVIFLVIIFGWNKIKLNFLIKLENIISEHKYEVFLLFCVLIYFVYFTTASFLRYDNFFTGRFDLGNMDQAVWNSIHGRLFQITDPNGTDIISRLSFHADFILVLISPLYLLWSNPKMLLLLQTLSLSLGAVFIYLLSLTILKNKKISLTLSLLFLLNPAVAYTNLFDFHPVTLATTLLLGAFYFFYRKKYIIFLVFGILSALCKEEIWVIISLFGFYLILENAINYVKFKKLNIKEVLFGFFVLLGFLTMFYYLIWIAIPQARGSNHFALSYYSDFGASPSQVIKNIFLDPIKTLGKITQKPQLTYLLQLLFPLAFLPLISLELLIFAAPDLLINLLSSNSQLHEIYYQYSASITPFLFIASIFSIKKLIRKFPAVKIDAVLYVLIFTGLISAYMLGPLPLSTKPNIDVFTKQLSNKNAIEDFISSIPTRYSISATNNLGSHLSRRQKIFTIPLGIDKADVILFLLNDPFAQPSLATQKEMAKKMESDKNYIQVYKNGDFIAFEKKTLYETLKPKKGQTNLFPYSIEALSHREYTASNLIIEREVTKNAIYNSFIASYVSDGLKEYTLLNIPNSQPPANGFPVLIINHGYIKPDQYDTVNSYKSISDYFSSKGFMVLKPDYRGNGNSEINDTSLMRFAYPIDVLNLIASVKNIQNADSNRIFLWSHSLGGEVTLEVLEIAPRISNISSKIKAAVFWAPVTDPVKWFSKDNLPRLPEAILTPYPYTSTFAAIGTPEQNPSLWQTLSPLNYLSNIQAPILLQHGTGDTTIPYSWSLELNNSLKNLNKNVTFLSYPSDSHNLPLFWNEAAASDLNFYLNY